MKAKILSVVPLPTEKETFYGDSSGYSALRMGKKLFLFKEFGKTLCCELPDHWTRDLIPAAIQIFEAGYKTGFEDAEKIAIDELLKIQDALNL